MKQRAKQLAAWVMTWVMIVIASPVAQADKITVNSTSPAVITQDSTDDYEISYSGGLTVKSPATLSGSVTLNGNYATLTVEQGAEVSGSVTANPDAGGVSSIRIQNYGQMTKEMDFTAVNDMSIYAGGSSETAGLILGSNQLTCEDGAKFGLLDLSAHTKALSLNGQMEIGTLRYDTGNAVESTVTMQITKALSLSAAAASEKLPTFVLADPDVKITKPAVVDPLKVKYAGHEYQLPAGDYAEKTLKDLYGYELSQPGVWTIPRVEYAGASASLTITITNTGSDTITLNPVISSGSSQFFTYEYYNADGSAADSDTIVLAAGADASVKLTSREGLDVGAYSGSYTITAQTADGNPVDWATKQGTVSLTVEKTTGTGSLEIPDSYYGAGYHPVLKSVTHDTKNAQIMYQKQGFDTWTAAAPTTPGTYAAKVVLPENAQYKELTLTDTFTISYYPMPKSAYTVEGTSGKNGYFTSAVTYRACDGFLISESQDGSYAKTIRYEQSVPARKIYMKKEKTGELTETLEARAVKIDRSKPEYTCDQKIKSGDTYYGESCTFTFTDENLAAVRVNGKVHKPKTGKHSVTVVLHAADDIQSYQLVAEDKAGHTLSIKIKLAEEWRKSGRIRKGKAVKLYKGQAYQLDSGTWRVSGDTTSYQGGQSFYVDTEGEYTFSQGE